MDKDDMIYCLIRDQLRPTGEKLFDKVIAWHETIHAVCVFETMVQYPLMSTFIASRKEFEEENPELFKVTKLHPRENVEDEWVNDWYYNEF